MKKHWKLSLNRNRHTEVRIIEDVPMEISDDESFDSNISKGMKNESDVNVSRTANVLNNAPKSSCVESSSILSYDISDDSSNDERSNNKDDIINKVSFSNSYNKSPSLFNWNKTSMPGTSSQYQNSTLAEANTSHNSRHVKKIFEEAPNKRQKLIIDLTKSSDDDNDDLASLNTFEKEASPPEVTIMHEEMISGIKVKFPVKPYSSQRAVMSRVNMIV